MKKLTFALFLAGFSISTFGSGTWPTQEYTIKIKNNSIKQELRNPLVIVHNRSFNLFNLGEKAGPELTELAEEGNSTPLFEKLNGSEGVEVVKVETGKVLPGEILELKIKTKRPMVARVSVLSKLSTTNDAFVYFKGLRLKKVGTLFSSEEIDAGTEENNEKCDYIPGPPCNGTKRAEEKAEGALSLFQGIKGSGDLSLDTFYENGPLSEIIFSK